MNPENPIHDVLSRYVGEIESLTVFAATALFFLVVYAFGSWATHKDWKKSKGALWLQIRKMREELDREEPNGFRTDTSGS